MPVERAWGNWQSPPEPINRILDAPLPAAVTLSPNHRWFVTVERTFLLPASELAAPKLAIAGLQINPQIYLPSQRGTFGNLTYKSLESPQETKKVDLPPDSRLTFFDWSHEGDRLSFVRVRPNGLELWMLDLPSGQTRRLTEPILNGTYYNPCHWLPGDEGFICKVVPPHRSGPPPEPALQGPLIAENLGRKAPARTYTNLLRNPHDEALFEYYLSSQVERIALNGDREVLLPPMLVEEAIPSPDGRYFCLESLHRPFSYQFPLSRFPKRVEVRDRAGKLVYTAADLPLADNIPIQFGSVRAGRRSVFWRSDRAATLAWVEALDGGDAGKPAEHRDALLELDAPFNGTPKQLWRSQYRFNGLAWGRDDVALAWEGWYDNRLQRIWRINPQEPNAPAQVLLERNYQDRYSDPGNPLLTPGPYGEMVLRFSPDGNSVYFEGRGASEAGVYPFLERRSLFGGETERLWQAQDPYYERVEALLDDRGEKLVTRRESQTEPPNYYWQDGDNPPIPLTSYADPAPELANVRKEILRYERADGLPLSATLYLPPDYDKERDGPLPAVFWVYPEEFKDAATAGQVDTAQNGFSRPYGFSILFLLLQGYAVVDDPALPIIGEEEREPNDTYLEQLLMGAKAAVEAVTLQGVIDPNRIAIGGHSYGAFTAANLLAHSDLFRAGIAASGAYNRTLTPFSFQGEQRSFWEARETYMEMSPFTYADRINEPLLLIHGMDDSNVGTYPMQSERLFEALKGLGATVRWVQLPYEDHGYRGRESVGHVLWEILQWCDRYL